MTEIGGKVHLGGGKAAVVDASEESLCQALDFLGPVPLVVPVVEGGHEPAESLEVILRRANKEPHIEAFGPAVHAGELDIEATLPSAVIAQPKGHLLRGAPGPMAAADRELAQLDRRLGGQVQLVAVLFQDRREARV